MIKQNSFRFELGHQTRNKRYPVRLCITIDGKRTRLHTSIELASKKDWNAKCKGENWIRTSEPNYKAWNKALADILEDAKEKHRDLSKDKQVTSGMVIQSLQPNSGFTNSFLEYAKGRMNKILNAGGFRNWKKYNSFMNKLEEFLKHEKKSDLLFVEITPSFLSQFENFLHSLNNQRHPERMLHTNYIQVIMKSFRALLRDAIKEKIIDPLSDPFINFPITGVETEKEKLNLDEIRLIEALSLEEGSLIWHCRNAFLFSFYCAGVRAGDLLQLRWCNITSDGRLKYQMGKNHKSRDLVLVEPAQMILKYYKKEGSKKESYIFPFMDETKPYAYAIDLKERDTLPIELKKRLLNDVSAKNALLNKYLKKIAEMAGIGKKVSMHISRHSFAKVAKDEGVDNLHLKSLMAHSSIKVTETYMGNFDTQKTDEAMQHIFSNNETTSEKERLMKLLEGMDAQQISTLLATIEKKS